VQPQLYLHLSLLLQEKLIERLTGDAVPSQLEFLLPYVNGLLSEALEEVKSLEPNAIRGRARIEAPRSSGRFRQLALEIPGPVGDETWNGAVLWRRADQILLIPVLEEVVSVH